jgi:pimeloyl-ACP methyl ester carboxylesterase
VSAEPRRRSVLCASPKGLHRIAYTEWGDARNPHALVCVHGLTRCGRDFDELARTMAQHYRVVCPDVAGRGDSDWLPDPSLYALGQYLADMVTLVARLDVAEVHWVGTSMGGLIGMALAALKNTPVAKLVLNDAGAVVSRASIERIAQYVGRAPSFASIEEAEAYIRMVSAPFGPHSDAQWRFLTEVVVRQNADGSYRLNYDPMLAETYRATMPAGDLELWPLYDAVRCPTLVLRGELSDLLTRETCVRMAQRGPRPRIVEIPGVGHAPTLLHAEQIEVVREFLLAPL